jgi:pilus assembly protein FimV
LHAHFSDLADQRRAMVENAIEAAQARDSGAAQAARVGDARANEDVGFAPTILSSNDRDGAKGERAAPTRRAGQAGRPSPPPAKEESKLTLGSAALEMEEVPGLPKRRGWVWAALLVVAGVGGWYGWRTRAADRVRAVLAPPPQTVAAPQPVPPPVATHAPIAAPTPVASVAAPIASVAATPPAPLASAPPPAVLIPGARPAKAIRPGAAPPVVAPTVTAEPPPPPAPPSDEDKDNPYN